MNIHNTKGSQDGVYTPEPRVYELGYHILPTVDEGNIETEREALVAIITKFKGMVISEEMPALIDLAYDMDKTINNKRNIFSQAYFGWIKFDVSPSFIETLADEVEALDSILRSLVIKTVRENTIVSEEPYRLAKSHQGNEALDGEDLDEDVEDEDFYEEEKNSTETDMSEEKKSSSDDLTKIEGIGPKIAEILVAAGINTFEALSSAKIGDLRNILESHKLSSHDPKTWSKQATLAKNEKWDKLSELQQELKGGKEA